MVFFEGNSTFFLDKTVALVYTGSTWGFRALVLMGRQTKVSEKRTDVGRLTGIWRVVYSSTDYVGGLWVGKWLAAIAKGLSYAAGPFKPVVDFAIKLLDGDLAEKANKKIQMMILGQQDVLYEILDILNEVRNFNQIGG